MASIPKRKRGRQRARLPKTLAQLQARPARSQASLENAARVITRMREGYSLTNASAEYGIDRRTVEKIARSALRKTKSGRYAPRASDNLVRVLVVPVHGGLQEVAVRGSRVASEVASRLAATRQYLETGDDSKLRKLQRKKLLDASGREIPFLADLDELERLGDAGILQFQTIYARRA
jgi:hypothetical protein